MYRNGTLIWDGLMLRFLSVVYNSIFNIMSVSWAFRSAELDLIRAGNKNNIPLAISIHCEKLTFSLVKLKMVGKIHFLSHDIQSETR